MSAVTTPSKQLRNHQVTILAPGNYSFLHYGHFRFFQDCKSAFSRVKLIVGIHDCDDSVLTPEEKAQTLAHIPAVDEVVLHLPKVNRQVMNRYKVDFVAVWTEYNTQRVQVQEILCLPGYPEVTTPKLAARIFDEEEDFVLHILEDELPAWECGLSTSRLHWAQFKQFLKRKAVEWFPQYIEDRASRESRLRIQQIIRRSTRFFDRLLSAGRLPMNRP